MRLALQYTPIPSLGYGAHGCALAKGLAAQGVKVEPHDAKTNVRLAVTIPGQVEGAWQGQFRSLWTMFEAMRLPEAYVESVDSFDQIIVPNVYNCEQFSAYHDNVAIAPIGVDPDTWVPSIREVDRTIDFLTCGSGARKGTDLTHSAFTRAFPNPKSLDPIPTLTMKTNDSFSGVKIINGTLPEPELVNLFASHHAFIMLSRGEGWGLFPHQALATGMPTVLSEIPGHLEYGWVDGGHLVKVRQTKAAYFAHGEAGDWWEADLDDAVDKIRWVYENYPEAQAQAQQGSQTIRTYFSANVMASQVINHLGGKEALSVDYKGSGEWIPRAARLFHVATRRPTRIQVNDDRYVFAPGQVYLVPADVKRMLHDAGYLDPAYFGQITFDGLDFTGGVKVSDADPRMFARC